MALTHSAFTSRGAVLLPILLASIASSRCIIKFKLGICFFFFFHVKQDVVLTEAQKRISLEILRGLNTLLLYG